MSVGPRLSSRFTDRLGADFRTYYRHILLTERVAMIEEFVELPESTTVNDKGIRVIAFHQ